MHNQSRITSIKSPRSCTESLTNALNPATASTDALSQTIFCKFTIMKSDDIKQIGIYIFAALSVLVAVRVLYVSISDFFDSNALAFQMFHLTPSQILLLDGIFIIIHLTLLILLCYFFLNKNSKKLFISSLAIWAFLFLEIFLESLFRHDV